MRLSLLHKTCTEHLHNVAVYTREKSKQNTSYAYKNIDIKCCNEAKQTGTTKRYKFCFRTQNMTTEGDTWWIVRYISDIFKFDYPTFIDPLPPPPPPPQNIGFLKNIFEKMS